MKIYFATMGFLLFTYCKCSRESSLDMEWVFTKMLDTIYDFQGAVAQKGLPFLFLFFSVLGFGATTPDDTTPVINNLKAELLNSDSKQKQVDIYNKIAFQLLFIDTALCMTYLDTVYSISKEAEYNQGFARALNIHSFHHIFQNRYHKGIDLNKSALSYCEEEDHFVKGKIYNAIGMAYQRMYVVDKCLENYHKALFHATENKDTMTTVVVLGNIASVHNTQDNNKEAKLYFLQLEKISSNHKDQNVQFAFHIRFAEFLTEAKEYEESLRYLEKALKNAESLSHNSKIRKVRLQMAINNINSGKYEIADICLQGMLSPELEPNEHTNVRYLYWKADLEFSRKNHLEAIQYALTGLGKINQLNDFHFYKPRFLRLLHKLERQTGNHNGAYSYLLELNAWQDSTDIKEREDKILELETKYQSEKKELENALLKEQSNSKTVKLKQRTALAFVSVLTVILCLFLLYNLLRNSRKEKLYNELLESKVDERTQKLKKSNEELERFSYIASHDLKEPIRNIKSFIQLLKVKLQPDKKSNEIDEYLDIVEKSTDQMHFLVNGILDYTKLGDNPNVEMVDLNEVIENVKVYLRHLISQKKTRIISKQLPTIECNPIQIFQVFKNLIENGIKYNESIERIIEIDSFGKGEFTVVSFKDNGIGIDNRYKDKVFEMFSRLHNREKYTGSGLGLSIVKKIINLMKGKISLEKSDSSGSTFYLHLPSSK